MEVLSRDLEVFLGQLAELAGGDSRIVQQAIAKVNAKPEPPTLEELVRAILELKRDAQAERNAAVHSLR